MLKKKVNQFISSSGLDKENKFEIINDPSASKIMGGMMAASCPSLVQCVTYTGDCPKLTGCGTYTDGTA